MIRSVYIAWNEVKLYLQDKGDLAFSLLLPILTFALIYGAFGGQTLFEATAHVVDEDKGQYSALLLEQLDEQEGITVDVITTEKAETKLDRSDVLLVLYIPEKMPSQSSFLSEGSSTTTNFHGWELQADGANLADSRHISIFSLSTGVSRKLLVLHLSLTRDLNLRLSVFIIVKEQNCSRLLFWLHKAFRLRKPRIHLLIFRCCIP